MSHGTNLLFTFIELLISFSFGDWYSSEDSLQDSPSWFIVDVSLMALWLFFSGSPFEPSLELLNLNIGISLLESQLSPFSFFVCSLFSFLPFVMVRLDSVKDTFWLWKKLESELVSKSKIYNVTIGWMRLRIIFAS